MKAFHVLSVSLALFFLASSASAGECRAFRAPADQPKAYEMLIIATKVSIAEREAERRFISNDERVIIKIRRVQTEQRPGQPASSAVFVNLSVDGKELLISEAASDGNSLITRAMATGPDGMIYGVNCISLDR